MSRRPAEYKVKGEFVSAHSLLARALEAEASRGARVEEEESAAIGAAYDNLHKCTFTVDLDGTVSCKGCGKGTAKKVSHKKNKKHAKPTKSY